MAFETVEEWKVERSFALSQAGILALPELPAQWPFRDKIAKLSSASLAFLFNGLFFYFLITNAFDRSVDDTPKPAQSKSTEMTMIALSELQEPTDLSVSDSEEDKPATISSARKNPIDLTSITRLPPEWTVGRIRESRTSVGDSSALSPSMTGVSGGGVYDPFAGAAPKRLTDQELAGASGPMDSLSLVDRVSGFFGFGSESEKIDDRAFDAWVRSLRSRLPRARGSVELAVTLDRQGAVTVAEIKGGSASQQVKFFVRNAIIGHRFSRDALGKDNNPIDLPSIVLG